MHPTTLSKNIPYFPPPKCESCGATDEVVKRCARCHFTRYCGLECQKKHWKTHKKSCYIATWPPVKDKQWKAPESYMNSRIAAMTLGMSLKYLFSGKKEQASTLGSALRGKLKIKSFWNYFQTTPYGEDNPIPDLVKEHFFTMLKKGEKKCGLDLGSGTGALTIAMLNRNWRMVAIDSSREANLILREHANFTNPDWLKKNKLIAIEKDITKYNFPDTQFDLVIANCFFRYVNPEKLQQIWKNIFKSLKGGGYLVGNFLRTAKKGDFTPKGMERAKRFEALTYHRGAWLVGSLQEVRNMIIATKLTCIILKEIKSNGVIRIEFLAQKKQLV